MFLMLQFHVKSYKISGSCHHYLMDFSEIFTSERYHRDMKALKILASNSKHFRICGTLINDKLVCLGWHFKYYFFFDNFCFKQSLVLKIWKFIEYFFWLKKFKNDIEIPLKPTGFELSENPVKIYHSVYICKRKRCGTLTG